MKRKIKILKFILTIIVIILVMQLFYVLYFFFFVKDNRFYFDGVNSIVNYEDNYYTVGSNNDNNKYYEKAKISKYDLDFNKNKEKLYNNEFDSTYYDLIVDEESRVAVGNYEEDKDSHKKNNTKALMIKYDVDGNVLFERTFGKLDKNSFTSIISYGDYYATGYSHSKDSGGAYLLKIDKDSGSIIWKSSIGNNKYSKYNDLVIVNNHIYCVGLYDKNIGIIAKYNLKGKLISSKKFNYTDSIGFSSITYDKDYLYVTGSKKDTIDSKNRNGLIIKYDYDLKEITNSVYNQNNSRYNKVIIDNDKVIVIGIYKKDNYNGIIGMYDKELEVIDTVTYGDEENDFFTDIIKVDGNYIVCGYSSYKRNYLTKFITYSNALKFLDTK